MMTSRLRLHRGDGIWWLCVNEWSPLWRDSQGGWIRLATRQEIDNFQCGYAAERSMTAEARDAQQIARDNAAWDAAVYAASGGVLSSDAQSTTDSDP